tara:strand:+ start:3526 stop:4041 length:516 start_codon:yes stop_codon:yes gene_type:complete
MALTIEIDFTDISAATGGLAILDPGLHTGIIEEFVHYTDNGNVIYAYINTDGLTHRERFSLDSSTGLAFLKAFLKSAGVPESKLGGKSKIPFDKFTGKKVYFNYTPPKVDENGKRMAGTYPKYIFYPEVRWNKMMSYQNAVPEQVAPSAPVASEPSNNGTKDGGEFDFLLS